MIVCFVNTCFYTSVRRYILHIWQITDVVKLVNCRRIVYVGVRVRARVCELLRIHVTERNRICIRQLNNNFLELDITGLSVFVVVFQIELPC